MTQILAFLDGKKTYLAAAGTALLALAALADGDVSKAGELFMAALGLAGVRHAVAKQDGGGDEQAKAGQAS